MKTKEQPIYKQLADQLQKKVDAGMYKSGEMIESESEFQKLHNVSRVTVRKTFKLLADKGVLKIIPGKGTFVNDVTSQDWTWMKSFTNEVIATGRVPTTKVLSFQIVFANEDLAEKLHITTGERCFYFRRVRFIDNKPVWLTKTYIPITVCPALTQEYLSIAGVTQSIFKVLELNFNIRFAYNEEISEAVNISEEDANVLQISAYKPVISTAMRSFNDKKKPVLYENTIFEQSISKGNNIRVEVESYA